MNISKLALIALLGSALMAFGCGGDGESGTAGSGGGDGGSGGSGGTPGPTCDDTACLFCPPEALDDTVSALFPDGLNVPITFTAEGDPVAGETATIAVAATSVVGGLPVSVGATLAGTSTTTYSATNGGTGSFEIPVPEQELSGTDLEIDAGSGEGEVDVAAEATELTIHMTEAVFDLAVTDPLPLPLTLDASEGGPCEMLGTGVTIPVSAPAQ